MSSSMLSSIPQNREKGSRVSGAAPKLMYDSPISVPDDDEDECRGDNIGSRYCEVVDVDVRLAGGRVLLLASDAGGRMAKGGTPLEGESRVAIGQVRDSAFATELLAGTYRYLVVAMPVSLWRPNRVPHSPFEVWDWCCAS